MSEQNQSPATRREFLKTSTAAAVGAGVLGNLAMSSGAYAAGDDAIKVGLVGCGGRGTGAATQALSTKGNVKLVAMADAFPDQIEKSLANIMKQFTGTPERVDVEDEFKFTGFDAYKKVLASDIDVVILTTPPGFRPIHFEAAVEAGKHVFMEKPVATDPTGIRKVLEVAEIAKKKKLAVGVGLQRHHQNTYLETLKRIKEDKVIGDLVALRVYWNSGGVWDPRKTRDEVKTEMEYQMRNWYYYTWLCGDHIVEQHIHNLDVGNWLMDDFPVRAYGMGGRQVRTDKKYGEIFDHFAVRYEYANGTQMFSECRHIRNCWNSVSEHAHGTKGTANVSGASYTTADGEKWKYKGPKNNPYQTEHDDLFAAIREGREYSEAERGAKSTMTAILGRLATYSGKPIEWEDAINSDISIMPKNFSMDADPPIMPNENGEYPIAVPGLTKTV